MLETGQGRDQECFPVPAPSTFVNKILSPSPSSSLNIAPYLRSKPDGSPQDPVPAGNIVIPISDSSYKHNTLQIYCL